MADDQALWRGICAGNASAFDELFREAAQRLRRFVRLYAGGQGEAEDIVQETFLQLWKRPNGYDPERGTLRQYLYGIARKRVAQKRRESAQIAIERDFERLDETRLRAGTREIGDLSLVMREALMNLDSNDRALLWLREIEGYSYAELAEILQVPLGTVKSRLFGARENLRQIWNCKPSIGREGG